MTIARPLTIRMATSADADLLAELGERTFRAAFEYANTPEDMAAYVAAHFSSARLRHELANPAASYYLALSSASSGLSGEEPIGYAKLTVEPAPAGVIATKPVCLSRLYVASAALGQGYGPALMAHCLHEAAAGGHDVVWLAVWEENERALAFYRRWGFETVGAMDFRLGADLQHDYVMARGVGIED